jgi:DNA modification methylase
MTYTVLQGNNIDLLKRYPDNHFDSIITDPPYGISFLGKDWDSFKNSKITKNSTIKNLGSGMRMTTHTENLNFQLWCEEWAKECFRVLKPGGYMLSFCAARMYHRMTVGLEDAGFEIRDQIMWIYSSGFPKSQDVGRSIQRSIGVEEYEEFIDTTKNAGFGQMDAARTKVGQDWSTKETRVGKAKVTDPEAKQWEGWGTALKPAHEPVALARKPSKLSIAKNCQTHGVGALNIDATRIPYEDDDSLEGLKQTAGNNAATFKNFSAEERTNKDKPKAGKRTASFHNATGGGETQSGGDGSGGWEASNISRFPSNVIGEIADYQKYFYCPKVSRKERHIGFDAPETQEQMLASIGGYFVDHEGNKIKSGNKAFVPGHGEIYTHGLNDVIKKIRGSDTATSGNNHPTVKPIELMKYLIKLVTPPGGHVLDPFCGSGSTGMAAVELGYDFTGCELDPAYVDIALKRITAWNQPIETQLNEEWFDE